MLDFISYQLHPFLYSLFLSFLLALSHFLPSFLVSFVETVPRGLILLTLQSLTADTSQDKKEQISGSREKTHLVKS